MTLNKATSQEASATECTFVDTLLPDEILLKIFSLLDEKSLANAMQVDRQWHHVGMNNDFWEGFLKRYPGFCQRIPPYLLTQHGTHHHLFSSIQRRLASQRWGNFGTLDGALIDTLSYDAYARISLRGDEGQRHCSPVSCLTVLSDGIAVSADKDHELIAWDITNRRFNKQRIFSIFYYTRSLDTPSRITYIAALPNQRVVFSGRDGWIRAWDIKNKKEIADLKIGYGITCFAVIQDRYVVSGALFGTVKVWDLETKKQIGLLEGHKKVTTCLAVMQDRYIVSGSEDNTVRVWDIDTKEQIALLKGHKKAITCLVVIQDRYVVSGSKDNTVSAWDMKTKKQTALPEGHRKEITCLAALPNERVASGSYDSTVRVWNIVDGRQLAVFLENEDYLRPITCLAVTQDRYIVFSRGTVVEVWDIESSKCIALLEEHRGDITCLAVTPDGRIISGSTDCKVYA